MSLVQEEIVRLSGIYYQYVGLGHHKDRDCHWYIETAYSYGQPPTFMAHHSGYRYDYWTGERRATYAEAEADLLLTLRKALDEAEAWATKAANDPEDWCGDEAREALEVLRGR